MKTECYLISKQSSFNCQDDYLLHYEISIRNEYMRFACMFYLFSLFAFITTILLFIFAYNSYQNDLESIQRTFIPYSVLGTISLILFFVFLIGSLVYTSKLMKKLHSKQTFQPPETLSRSIDNLSETLKEKSMESLAMNSDYATTKVSIQQKFKQTNPPCQTDV